MINLILSKALRSGGNTAPFALLQKKLGALLVELKKRGLIDLFPDKSLRILDINGLDELAEQRDDPLSASRPQEGVADRIRWSLQHRVLSDHLHAA